MGNINFVDNPENKTPVARNRDKTSEVEWTQPSGGEDFDDIKTGSQKTDSHEKISHENTKVSAVIEEKRFSEKVDRKSGFMDFFASLFKGKKPASLADDSVKTFRDEKKVLAEQSIKASQEKLYRTKIEDETQSRDAGIVKKNEKIHDNVVRYSEAKKLSIRDMIKMKLKLDSLGESADNIKTNLLQDEATIYIDWKKNGTKLVLNILVSTVIIGLAYGGLMYREQRAAAKEQGIDKNIQTLSKQLESAAADVKEIDLFQKKLTLVTGILDKHVYWTNFFAFIEKTILDEVTYSGDFSGSTEGAYSFAATADSFQTVENQVKVLSANKLVKKVSVDSLAFVAGGEASGMNIPTVSFTIAIEVDNKLFNIDSKTFDDFFINPLKDQIDEK